MSIISLQKHVQLTNTKNEKVNELIANCFSLACAKTGSLRDVLKGDMKIMVKNSRLRKAS
ncbi:MULTISPECIES: hypothetical protein [Acinetobacter]|uniref:hypothetical protein n=1 Tax=Acinetobacter TaxID=469 RepID=UPI0002D0E131|nr:MULTISPECIES: hypothetical protein [Acinetobacter]ENX60742.1 hypothetical protein F885_01850 [Acinetobacter higginsii]MCH7318655.1 hypothetical protein [Acinetobacter higginsii]MCH7380405.1 hypothetical protein [Acinetobacter higginsii]WEI20154.1 hypothetical protein PY247_10760 [Acinetobacter proteolyticus]